MVISQTEDGVPFYGEVWHTVVLDGSSHIHVLKEVVNGTE